MDMDKLELDARVARLERTVSRLTALILASLLLIGVFGVLQLTTRSASIPAAAPAVFLQPPQPSVAAPPVMEATKAAIPMDR
jgi:hypothetical protein